MRNRLVDTLGSGLSLHGDSLPVFGRGMGGGAQGTVLRRAGALAESGEGRRLVAEQRRRRRELDDATGVQNEDAVRVDDGVEAVRDGHGGSVREVLAKNLLKKGVRRA